MQEKIKVIYHYRSLKIYFDDVLHLYIKHLTSFQSWVNNVQKKYIIEYYDNKNNEIKTEYLDEDIWKNILKQLDHIL